MEQFQTDLNSERAAFQKMESAKLTLEKQVGLLKVSDVSCACPVSNGAPPFHMNPIPEIFSFPFHFFHRTKT